MLLVLVGRGLASCATTPGASRLRVPHYGAGFAVPDLASAYAPMPVPKNMPSSAKIYSTFFASYREVLQRRTALGSQVAREPSNPASLLGLGVIKHQFTATMRSTPCPLSLWLCGTTPPCARYSLTTKSSFKFLLT